MSRLLAILATSAFLLVPIWGAFASERSGPVQLAQSDPVVEKVFDSLEHRVIREVLGAAGVDVKEVEPAKGGKKAKGSKGAPPGLAKRARLPPGLERQLQRNGRLPPGLEKKRFPADLRAQLPSPLQGTERVIIGNDAVLIETATNIVLDIIYDVFGNRK